MILDTPILYTRFKAVAQITLNRPAVLNAIDMNMATMLRAALHTANADDTVRVVLITGQGEGFCSGGDLRFALAMNPILPGDSFLALTAVLHESILAIRTMPKPVIVAINGPAAGAGLFLALAADLCIMADTAYLKQSNTSYGLSIPAGGTFFLPRLVGWGRTMEIAILDEPISAQRALELGLVTQVHPLAELGAAAQTLAQGVAVKAVGAIGRVKQLLNQSLDRTLAEQLDYERQAIAASANSAEGRTGVLSFLEKRPADYVGALH